MSQTKNTLVDDNEIEENSELQSNSNIHENPTKLPRDRRRDSLRGCKCFNLTELKKQHFF